MTVAVCCAAAAMEVHVQVTVPPVELTANTIGVDAPSRIGVTDVGLITRRWNSSRWVPDAKAT